MFKINFEKIQFKIFQMIIFKIPCFLQTLLDTPDAKKLTGPVNYVQQFVDMPEERASINLPNGTVLQVPKSIFSSAISKSWRWRFTVVVPPWATASPQEPQTATANLISPKVPNPPASTGTQWEICCFHRRKKTSTVTIPSPFWSTVEG